MKLGLGITFSAGPYTLSSIVSKSLVPSHQTYNEDFEPTMQKQPHAFGSEKLILFRAS